MGEPIRRPRNRVRGALQVVVDRVAALMRRDQLAEELPPVQDKNEYLTKLLSFMKEASSVRVISQDVNMQDYYTFHIKRVLVNDTQLNVFNTYLKAKIMTEEERTDINKNFTYLLVEKEMNTYNHLIEKCELFQTSWGFLETKYSDLFPKCFAAGRLNSTDGEVETPDRAVGVLIDNLKDMDYNEIMEPCGLEDAEQIVKRLALLHATPLAMILQRHGKDDWAKIKAMLQPLPLEEVHNVDRECERISHALQGQPGYDQNAIKIKMQLQTDSINNYRRLNIKVPWTTLCYSQCSIRKIMYKRSSEENATTDIKFSDMQYIQVDSCISDLMFFILTSTTREVVNSHMEAILSTYFMEFSRIMAFYYVEHPAFQMRNFVAECKKSAKCNMVRIFREIGHLYHDGGSGVTVVRGDTYYFKLSDAYNVLRDWL